MAKKPKAPKLQEATPKLGGAFAGKQYFYNKKGELVDQAGVIQTPSQIKKLQPFLNEYDPNYGKPAPVQRPAAAAPKPESNPEPEVAPLSEAAETPAPEVVRKKPGRPKGKKTAPVKNAGSPIANMARFAGKKILQDSFPKVYGFYNEYKKDNVQEQEKKTKTDNKFSEDKRTQSDIKAGLDLTDTLMKDTSYLIRQSLANEEKITTILNEISLTLSQIKWLMILKAGIPSLGGLLGRGAGKGAGLLAGGAAVALGGLAIGSAAVLKNSVEEYANIPNREDKDELDQSSTKPDGTPKTDEEMREEAFKQRGQRMGGRPPAQPAYAAGTAPAGPRNALADLNQTKSINAAKENTLEKNKHISVELDDLLFKSSKITFDTQKFTLDARSIETIKKEKPVNSRESQGATAAVPGGGSSPPSAGSETTPGGGGGGAGGGGGSGSQAAGPQAAGGGPQGTTPQAGANGAPTGSQTTPGSGSQTPTATVAPGTGKGYEESGMSRQEIAEFIKQEAVKRGIDPAVALAVAKSEGLDTYTGDKGTSHGPFQLHYRSNIPGLSSAGLGDEFTRQTGLDARDPKTVKEQIKFSLDQAKKTGWGPWHGAAKIGITGKQGIGAAPPTAPDSTTPTPTQTPNSPSPRSGTPVSENQPDTILQQRQTLAELKDTGFSRTRAFADGTEDNGSFFRKEYETNPQYRENQKKQGRFLDDKLLGGAGQDFQKGNYGSGLLGLGGAALNFIPGIGPVAKGVAGQGIDMARDKLRPQESTKEAPGAMPKGQSKPRLPRESSKAAQQQQEQDPRFKLEPSRMSQWNQTKNPSAMHDQNIQRSYRVHDPAGKISREVGF
jgi:hypothetical protein